jgi:hypothetical protein
LLPLRGAHAQCEQYGGAYEGFLISSVTVQSPLQFPVEWIENSLLRPVTTSLQDVAAGLPVKKGHTFRLADQVFALQQLTSQNTNLATPGEKVAVAYADSSFQCDLSARTVAVTYHVYSTKALYFASRLMETAHLLPNRTLTIGKASETEGRPLVVPFFGYNLSAHGFGGAKMSWSRENGLLNSAEFEGSGSASSYLANVKLGGVADPPSGPISHAEWNVGYRAEENPSRNNSLRSAVGLAQGDVATRAVGSLGTIFRLGGSVLLGISSSDQSTPQALADAPERVLKLYAGTTFSHGRNIWNVSYGFQLGKGTQTVPVNYTKQIVDLAHQVRFLPREHWPIQLDSHLDAGWIFGAENEIPVVQRFFGGNRPGNFVNSQLWRIPSGPLLRSFPENWLNQSSNGAAIGGTSFAAINETVAFPVWTYPAIPAIIRFAKPLQDGINLGLQEAERASLEDYRARASLFSEALRQAEDVVPDLQALRRRLSDLNADASLPDDLKAQLQDLIDTIDAAVGSVAEARKTPSSGIAWSAIHRLSGEDTDSNPLAHINDVLTTSVIPSLKDLHREEEAKVLQLSANAIDRDRQSIAAVLSKIEPEVVISNSTFENFRESLSRLNQSANELLGLASPFVGQEAPFGSTAFETCEWARSLATSTDPLDPPTDPFDELYTLTRLAIGVGKLVPPQVESVATAADNLAQTINDGDTESAAAMRAVAASLRDDLKSIAPQVKAIRIPPGQSWAQQQNSYFVRALDVAFREMNLSAVSAVAMFDAAYLAPQPSGFPSVRYGIGPGIRFSIVSFQATVGYSFNPSPKFNEPRGAVAFSMDIVDLFR